MENGVIKPINKETVHRICSGQVVLNLAIAVKELIENAIDASATNIEVRLKEYGLDLIEVLDNGTGVKSDNFEALTLKHHTSKIQQFNDLESVGTLGFRGEALSSLCALSNLTIITKHESAEYATKIEYDHNGLIKNQVPAARCQGTSVVLTNLFSTLPVRRKELTKNSKREFNKMCQLLYAYCLVCKNIKFSCSNATIKGSRSTVACTQGLNSVKDNIVAIFGSKQIASLIDVTIAPPEEAILQEYSIKSAPEGVKFEFEFFVSSAMHGHGRSTADRQFYYINSRPCEPNKISKLVNEIYKQFNGNQYPFVYLNINLCRSEVDVNVTPDKRQIFLQEENLLLATIKSSLLHAFKDFPSIYQRQNIDISKRLSTSNCNDGERGVKRGQEGEDEGNGNMSSLAAFRKKDEENLRQESKKVKTENSSSEAELKQVQLRDCKNFAISKSEDEDCNKSLDRLVDLACQYLDSPEKLGEKALVEDKLVCQYSKESKTSPPKIVNISDKVLTEPIQVSTSALDASTRADQSPKTPKSLKLELSASNLDESPKLDQSRSHVTWNVSLDEIVAKIDKKRSNADLDNSLSVKFRSKITPNANQEAEKELQKNFSKHLFKEIDVVGQFNLAFIIGKLKNDLFIIDQHASDEKYNFEQLQSTTVMENQKLVNPKRLELTAGNESLLIENIDIFRKNGFEFNIDDEAEATSKVFLTAVPMSKNYCFGKDDIDEMLFMLKDSNLSCRPSKVRSIFASRACRKSVMVGRHLAKNEMKRIVNHMGEIEQPWNCPHGRPTMRHLVNLNLFNNG